MGNNCKQSFGGTSMKRAHESQRLARGSLGIVAVPNTDCLWGDEALNCLNLFELVLFYTVRFLSL